MKGAALTVGGFYAHFSSKDELVEETLRRTGATLRERLFARLDEKSEADRAETILKRYSRPSTATAARPGARCQVVGEIGTTARATPDDDPKECRLSWTVFAQRLPADASSRAACCHGLIALMYGGLTFPAQSRDGAVRRSAARLPRAGAAARQGRQGRTVHERRGGRLDGPAGAASRDPAETDSTLIAGLSAAAAWFQASGTCSTSAVNRRPNAQVEGA